MKTVTVHQAKTHLSRLLTEVEQDGEVTICRGRHPVARLAPLRKDSAQRPKVGEVTSRPVTCSEDCFAPLTDAELKDWEL